MHALTLRTYQYETARASPHVPMVLDKMVTASMKLAPFLEQPAEDFHSIAQLGKLFRREAFELRGEVGDAHLASILQQTRAFRCGGDAHTAGILGIFSDLDQAAALEASDDTAHSGRLDLFCGGEFLQRLRSAENQHGQGGKTRRALTGGDVLLAHAAQQVNGGGVQAIGNRENGIVNCQFPIVDLQMPRHGV